MEIIDGKVESNWVVVLESGGVLHDIELRHGDEVAIVVKRKRAAGVLSPFWFMVTPWLIVLLLIKLLIVLWFVLL